MKKKIIPFMDLSDYKVLEEDVDAVYLSWEEISAIYHLDLSQEQHLEKYGDLLELIFRGRMSISGNSAKKLVNSYYKNYLDG